MQLRPDLKGRLDLADTRRALGHRRRARDLIRGAHDARQRHDASVDVNDNVAQPEIGISEEGRADGGGYAGIIQRDADGADRWRGSVRARRRPRRLL